MKKRFNFFMFVVVAALLMLSIPIMSYAVTRTVGPGQQYQTIQAGIDASSDGDTVVINDDVYTGEGNKNIDFKGKAIQVLSKNGRDRVIIDCKKDGRGFIFQSGEGSDSILTSVTIRNAKSRYRGGGILCKKASSPKLINLKIEDCVGMMGGGICAEKSSPGIENCHIQGCGATKQHGGGIAIYGAGDKNYLIKNCTITGNKARGNGGGIYTTAGSKQKIEISSTTISRNSAKSGGGVNFNGDLIIMTGGSITRNTASNRGGGAYINYGSSVLMDNVIIEKNKAGCSGGGIYSYGHPSKKASIVFLKGNISENQLQGGLGGGVGLKGANASFSGTIFRNNTHYAIAIDPDLTIPPFVTSDCQFAGNTPNDFNYGP